MVQNTHLFGYLLLFKMYEIRHEEMTVKEGTKTSKVVLRAMSLLRLPRLKKKQYCIILDFSFI